MRIILNKSDQVDQQQLMRVYGALMWSLGKVFKSPEVCKVRRGGEAHQQHTTPVSRCCGLADDTQFLTTLACLMGPMAEGWYPQLPRVALSRHSHLCQVSWGGRCCDNPGDLCAALCCVVPCCARCQVYIGSFNSDAPINAAKNPHCVELFKAEQADLLSDLYEIPSRSCDRKVRQSARLRMCCISRKHACVCMSWQQALGCSRPAR